MKAAGTVKSKPISNSYGKPLLDLKSQVRMELQVKKLHPTSEAWYPTHFLGCQNNT